MPLIVEDGTGYPNADSYCSVAACSAYAIGRGLTFDTADDPASEAALRVATSYVDNTYRLRFPGYRTNRRGQSLEWPRTNAYYTYPEPPGDTPYFVDPRMLYPFDLIPINSIPPEITTAVCEAAIRAFGSPGVLQPDLDRGGLVSTLKAGSVEVKYAAGAPAQTVFQIIDAALSGLIGVRSSFTSRAQRV